METGEWKDESAIVSSRTLLLAVAGHFEIPD